MQCLEQVSETQFQLPAVQPADYTTCTYVLAQPQDVHADIWNLTTDDAIQLMPLFAVVLVTGFSFRALARALKIDERSDYE